MKKALIAAGVVVVLGIVLWPSLRSADGSGKAVEVEIQSKVIEVATGPDRVLRAPNAGDPIQREKKEGSTSSQS